MIERSSAAFSEVVTQLLRRRLCSPNKTPNLTLCHRALRNGRSRRGKRSKAPQRAAKRSGGIKQVVVDGQIETVERLLAGRLRAPPRPRSTWASRNPKTKTRTHTHTHTHLRRGAGIITFGTEGTRGASVCALAGLDPRIRTGTRRQRQRAPEREPPGACLVRRKHCD